MNALNRYFSLHRLLAIIVKEFIQMRRDKLTFAMMVGIPLLQLTLFGYAINSDPKHLPAVVVAHEQSEFTRSIVAALRNTDYLDIRSATVSERDASEMLARGEVQFVLTIPPDFSRRLIRGERAQLLLEADATDPSATGNAIAALQQISGSLLRHDLRGPLAARQTAEAPFELVIHRRYNPDALASYNVIPGLVGVILTMTMIMSTALGLTREVERGTMENLLATPVRPLEVMIGKIMPYVIVGLVSMAFVLTAARWLFHVPFIGSLPLLCAVILLFIAANLVVGITVSSLARNQMQALQMTFFFFLPSILLSGFMFPFRGMPVWAQWIGEALPLTHFMRITRGVMLKGNGLAEIWPDLWPLLLFMLVMMALGLGRFRRTLD
ncbi:MAG: mannose-1-phosphate guanyltransferase [Candidatus Dactylopiibacterium carminicum]|uniref:ABC transporter permease n=1 Tax=Candidatus Dactylopiibacterium carminicum TaxID=857335 RepID=A0A272EWD3_9RHOO|nr:ABC transporter permease [Candidatus Dactylopiibacterium carminicum]KAF7599573.1 ABC transporter permease [Candidatus Dactylopiibacterium carminicum]PAS94415.1 MAG: mannose-1-phosphate guanyltransferase [Candidatus Dactylopiibacterium carminicum]PAS96422.1 MAG: mannose-1-phosphate guanyltransferase [Candidatus Dactylopiibacterium carminicum]PAS99576.1 MAG: mannose-1-phosphate guanyltransferase [Candidatus Dactylopiibacterium carminicum]